ncbi:uncharacterized protein RAG0_13359 [Rhynchosporium agropyri]|uniref:Uncharacterized protein n=1 Tax=Rhynchosporium agropyri TaxID=914238 RepID=A0A1E1LCE9_9HELO|nr:uncharacterized protein RAG0_13359 [Rhynchosporium agropyri]
MPQLPSKDLVGERANQNDPNLIPSREPAVIKFQKRAHNPEIQDDKQKHPELNQKKIKSSKPKVITKAENQSSESNKEAQQADDYAELQTHLHEPISSEAKTSALLA